RKILVYVYAGADHINIDSIEAECSEMLVTEPEDAERFFGNRLVRGSGRFLKEHQWDAQPDPGVVPDGSGVAGGMAGSWWIAGPPFRLEPRAGSRFTPTYAPVWRPRGWIPAGG